jgi:hypothetical protein
MIWRWLLTYADLLQVGRFAGSPQWSHMPGELAPQYQAKAATSCSPSPQNDLILLIWSRKQRNWVRRYNDSITVFDPIAMMSHIRAIDPLLALSITEIHPSTKISRLDPSISSGVELTCRVGSKGPRDCTQIVGFADSAA